MLKFHIVMANQYQNFNDKGLHETKFETHSPGY